MARFYQNQIVNPISNQYNPSTLKYIDDAGAFNQENTDKQLAGISELQSIFNLPGGYRTQQRAKDIVDQYAPEMQKLTNEIASTGNVSGGISRLMQLKNSFNSNPEVQAIRADQEQKGVVDKMINEQGFGNYIQDFIDPKSKGFIQTKPGEKFDARWYNAITPGNTNAEYKPLFDQVKPKISRYYNDPNYEITKDELGNIHTRSVQTGEEVESISRDDIKKAMSTYILNDPNALNKQSIIYNKKLAERNGTEYTNDNALNDISNAFLGEFETKKEIQKVGADKVSKPLGGGSGSGSGNRASDFGIPNDIYDMQINLENKGEASVDKSTAAALLGGFYDKNSGKTSITIDGTSPTFLSVPNKVSGTSSDKDGVEVSKAIPYQIEVNRIKDSYRNKLQDLISGGLPYIDENSKLIYYMDPKGFVHESENDGQGGSIEKRKISLDQFVQERPEYQSVAKNANSQGINIYDKKFEKSIKSKDPEELDFISNFSLAVNSINGNFEFNTDPNGNNVFTGDDGSEYVKGFITVTENELEDTIDNWSKAEDLGIIKKQTKKVKNEDGDMVSVYNLPIIRRVDVNLKDAVSNQILTKYGDTDKTRNLLSDYQQSNLDLKQQRVYNKDINNQLQFQLSSNEGRDSYSSKIRKNISDSFPDDFKKQVAYEDKLDEIEISNESKENKAKARIILDLKIKSDLGDNEAKNKYNYLLNSVNQSKESDLGARNNNPGNLTDGKELKKFNSIEEGFSAMIDDLNSKKSGNTSTGLNGDSTVLDLTSKYAPKDDGKNKMLKGNNPESYAESILEYLGLEKDTPLKYIPTKKLAEAMIKVESPDSYKILFNS